MEGKEMKKYLLITFVFIAALCLNGYSQPANDNCANAITLNVGNNVCTFSSNYGNNGATADIPAPPLPGCGNYLGGDVWFKFTVPASGHVIIDTRTPSGGVQDLAMAIYSGTCSSLTLIECDDDDSDNGTYMPKIDRSGLTPGSTVYIRVWEYGNNDFGNFEICIFEPSGTGPCSNVTAMNCGAIQTATITTGLGEWNTPYCGTAATGKEKIFAYTPTETGATTLTVTSITASTNANIAYNTNCGTTGWTCIARTNATGTYGPFNLEAGITYYFIIDLEGIGTATREIQFYISCLESGGTYKHPTQGIQGTYNGACMVNTSSGTYTDDGGLSNPYSNNINSIYRTFCPDQPGKALQATIHSLNIELSTGCENDALLIRDGPTQASPMLWGGCGNWNPDCPMTFKATNSSGCLTFTFWSNASVVTEGWNITLSTYDTAIVQTNNDCTSATAICGATNLSASSPGPGLTSTCGGCNLSENYSNWYFFEITDDGKLALDIKPENLFDDYDLALYQSDNCSNLGNPIRCSYAMAPNYCFPSSSQTCTANITRLRFNTIDNTSGGYSSGLYANYTNISTNVMKGSTYTLTVDGQTIFGTVYLRAWFDWNKNLTFDAGELYNLGTSTSDNYSISSNITIPATARLGTTAFRVFANEGSYQTNPCNTTNTGEAETYRIFIQDGTHCSNGIKDADEEGVDCGGADCVPCNASYWPTNTGMNGTATDFSEDVYGDSWINWVSVTAGQRYYLMVNNWSPNANGFDLIWNFSEGGAMDCELLPVELMSFDAKCNNGFVDLSWEVASETNNDYFVVLKSYNGIAFGPIDTLKGRGNANTYKKYQTSYIEENKGNVYYKLKQIDFDGKFAYSDMIASSCGEDNRVFNIYPNPVIEGENWKISGVAENDKVEIYDLSGRKYDKEDLRKGVYIVLVNNKPISKLIIQ